MAIPQNEDLTDLLRPGCAGQQKGDGESLAAIPSHDSLRLRVLAVKAEPNPPRRREDPRNGERSSVSAGVPLLASFQFQVQNVSCSASLITIPPLTITGSSATTESLFLFDPAGKVGEEKKRSARHRRGKGPVAPRESSRLTCPAARDATARCLV